MPFLDRVDAGRRLSARLLRFRGPGTVVLGLPRGGVPVAAEAARALGAPLDVIVVRKLGVPDQPELGLGAIGEGGVRVINPEVVRMARIGPEQIAGVERRERAELDRRARRFRGGRAPARVHGRTAIVVDDGIATGATARAACQVARAQGAAQVVLAAPVAPRQAVAALAQDADEVVCLETPDRFAAIGEWYEDFAPTRDEEVVELLRRLPGGEESPRDGVDAEVEVAAGSGGLPGRLVIPPSALGIVVFAHGSGSSRHSPRNQQVAAALRDGGLGTLLFDLLAREEEADRGKVFDIALLAGRLGQATRWLRGQPAAARAPVGYFGASTGAGAALWAAAEPDSQVAAVVSRGGRPDLAAPRLAAVRSPTLLIVGGHDDVVLDLNRHARQRLRCDSELAVVPGATHLFEEPGTLEQVAALARDWFTRHLAPTHASA